MAVSPRCRSRASLGGYEAFFTSNDYLEKVRPDETWFTLEGVMLTDELVAQAIAPLLHHERQISPRLRHLA